MKKKCLLSLTACIVVITLTSCEILNSLSGLQDITSQNHLSNGKIIAGLKEALSKGTGNAVQRLSGNSGFSKNSPFHIGIPKELDKVASTMKNVGLGFMVDKFELKMNEAAKEASSSAGPVFMNAIKEMTFTDAENILHGSDTAATDYLKKTTSAKLIKLYKPIVVKNMKEVGVVDLYNQLMDKYDKLPFSSKPNFSLDSYITDKAITSIFSLMAEEEKKIRNNPMARTTALLKEVFGR